MRKELDFKGVNAIEFHKRFNDDAACYEYLSIAKWPDNNFTCKKCVFKKYCNGKKLFSRRCLRCTYDESPTAGTAFDKVKFSLHQAFHIIFKTCARNKELSTLELSREFSLRQKTCWAFK